MTRRQRVALAVIVTVGLLVRTIYFLGAVHSGGFVWSDPDGYLGQALRLVRRGEWAWNFSAIVYVFKGHRYALPPGYFVFLSVFMLFPRFPLTAQIAQLLLGVISIVLVFALGRRVHSVTAGLIAAAGFALWVPSIFNVWSTSQETLYIPLILLTFVLLGRAIDRDGPLLAFGAAGLVCATAALTRSMPLFFVLPAAGTHIALASDRRRASWQAAAFVVGFLVLIVPYSAALSRYFGSLTIIDTHGSIHLVEDSRTPPGVLETGRALSEAIAANPVQYLMDCLQRARSVLHVNGGRILQTYVIANDRREAVIWKAAVHLGADALLVFTVVLAPIGAAVCRQSRMAAMLVLWAAVNLLIASVGGFGGARLRTPFEPLLLVLAAAACAGGWRRPRPAALGLALVTSCIAAIAVGPQVRASLLAWPDYGVKWPTIFTRQTGQFSEAAGLNVPAPDGVARLTARPMGDAAVQLHVRVNDVVVRSIQLPIGEETSILVPWPARGMAFIELDVSNRSPGSPGVRISVPGQ